MATGRGLIEHCLEIVEQKPDAAGLGGEKDWRPPFHRPRGRAGDEVAEANHKVLFIWKLDDRMLQLTFQVTCGILPHHIRLDRNVAA